MLFRSVLDNAMVNPVNFTGLAIGGGEVGTEIFALSQSHTSMKSIDFGSSVPIPESVRIMYGGELETSKDRRTESDYGPYACAKEFYKGFDILDSCHDSFSSLSSLHSTDIHHNMLPAPLYRARGRERSCLRMVNIKNKTGQVSRVSTPATSTAASDGCSEKEDTADSIEGSAEGASMPKVGD